MIEEYSVKNGQKTFRLFLNIGEDITHSLGGNGSQNSGKTTLLNDWMAAKQAGGARIELIREWGFPAAVLVQQLEGLELPDELRGQGLDDDWVRKQFAGGLFEQTADVYVFSLLSEITAEVWQRKERGYLLTPPVNWKQEWTAEQQKWFQSNFEPCGQRSAQQYKDDFGRIVERLQSSGEPEIIVYGVSSYDPVDRSHNYHSVGDTPTIRAHRFNHALIQLSQEMGVVIVDVDRIIAEMGGQAHVRGPFTYSPEVNTVIGQELFRVVEDMGYFDEHPLLKLVVPQLDLQFQSGSVVKWHKREGKWVNAGDDLFDLKVEEIKRKKRVNTDRPAEIQTVEVNSRSWSWLVRVVAVDNGFFRKRLVSEKESCSVGDILAVFSVRDNERVQHDEAAIEDAPTFRVVTNLLETSEQDGQGN